MAAERKLDIFEVLNAINAKKSEFFDHLTDEEAKTIQPFVLMRWLTGTDDEQQIILLNEFVNPVAFTLTTHKKLLWQLLTICNSGTRQRYQWLKLPGKRIANKPIATELIKKTYGINTKEAIDTIQLLSEDQLIDMAFDAGMTGEEVTKLKKELKK